jgi:hypothetical protein
VNDDGLPLQPPLSTVAVTPTVDPPAIFGGVVDRSVAPAAATGPRRLAYALVVPVESVAATVSPTSAPASAAPSR